MSIDYEELRDYLIDYYGTASSYNPASIMDVVNVEMATNNELISIADDAGVDLNDFRKKARYLKKR